MRVKPLFISLSALALSCLPTALLALPHESILAVRANGMGGAFTAVADDLDGPVWNPAGLRSLQAPTLGTSFSQVYDDIRLFGFSFGQPTVKRASPNPKKEHAFNTAASAFSASLNILDYGKIDRRDEIGRPLGSAQRRDVNFSGTAASSFFADRLPEGDEFSLGVNLGYRMATLQGSSGKSEIDFGLGTLYKGPLGLSAGLSMSGLGATTITNDRPLRLGLGWRPSADKYLLAADLEDSSIGKTISVGAEMRLLERIAFRGGISKHPDSMLPSAGLSFFPKKGENGVQLDYAASLAAIGPRHTIAVSYVFGESHRKKVTDWQNRIIPPGLTQVPIRVEPFVGDPKALQEEAQLLTELLKVFLNEHGLFKVLESERKIDDIRREIADKSGKEFKETESGYFAQAQYRIIGRYFQTKKGGYSIRIKVLNVETGEKEMDQPVSSPEGGRDLIDNLKAFALELTNKFAYAEGGN